MFEEIIEILFSDGSMFCYVNNKWIVLIWIIFINLFTEKIF